LSARLFSPGVSEMACSTLVEDVNTVLRTGAGSPEDKENDLYSRLKFLQRELEFLEIQVGFSRVKP